MNVEIIKESGSVINNYGKYKCKICNKQFENGYHNNVIINFDSSKHWTHNSILLHVNCFQELIKEFKNYVTYYDEFWKKL